ncbi:MAG: TetR/AcrR family transcriptional regulator [Actinomycetota bacterium]|nr:TetR/AcrR family transcriptional regulator [Actinomycetota bacterium]
MDGAVKTKFPRREKKAKATRRAVLEAAKRLFVESGYGATTIQAIADEADVAVQTVYAVFGGKRAILGELLDVSIAGDEAPIVVNAREWMTPVWEAPTAAERLRAYAAAVRRIMDNAGDVFTVVAAAATTDPDAVELAHQTEQRRRTGARSVVDALTSVGPLRSGLTLEEAVDVLWLLNSPALFSHFVRRAGWTSDRYQEWLSNAMVTELLGEQRSAKPRRSRPAGPKSQ